MHSALGSWPLRGSHEQDLRDYPTAPELLKQELYSRQVCISAREEHSPAVTSTAPAQERLGQSHGNFVFTCGLGTGCDLSISLPHFISRLLSLWPALLVSILYITV